MLNRDEQIQLLEALEKRLESYAQSWLANSEYKEALHRYDGEHHDAPELKRAVG